MNRPRLVFVGALLMLAVYLFFKWYYLWYEEKLVHEAYLYLTFALGMALVATAAILRKKQM